MPATHVTLFASSQTQTSQIATALAKVLTQGDAILLDGSLAAGKTYFTRALVAALGSSEDVTSPTYTIANIYETERAPVLHADAYRLSGTQEFYALGLDDYFETGICIIEWGVRIDGFFEDPLAIEFSFGDDSQSQSSRTLSLTAHSPRWAPVLETLAAKFGTLT